MEPRYYIVLNILGPGDEIHHDSTLFDFEGSKGGFKAAVRERDRLEAEYVAHHGTHTDDGRRVAHEIEMW